MVYKNVNQAATQYYPSPQITVYLQKTLDDDAAAGVVAQLQAEQGVEKVNYLSREDALGEFRNWSGLVVRWICWKKTRFRQWRW